MDELNEFLKPSWGAEQWVQEGWSQLNVEEKTLIKDRLEELFKDGLPFTLKHDKLLYIYTFSLLAQLEVLAIQVPLKFQHKMSTPAFRDLMRVQLLDEIFHGLVFTKIVYLLCAPLALPPKYSASIEVLCNFIRQEECPKVAVMLLNLIGEGWIEEIFYSLSRQNIAPKVFKIILEDEHRHVCEADLYQDIGLPDMEIVRKKMAFLEEQLLTNIFMQYKYVFSVSSLLGVDGAIDFMQSLNKKHMQQLSKINLQPSDNWIFFMKIAAELIPKIKRYTQDNHEIEMSPIRKVFMTQWDNPSDPTMVGQFNLNIGCVDFFNKKYPPETVTTLMMQAISSSLMAKDSFRTFLSQNKLYQGKEAYVGLIVKLPDCGDHIGTIVFENCHLYSVQKLALRIRDVIRMMVYCYKKREYLEKTYPELRLIIDNMLYDFSNDLYEYPMPGNSVVSLSNIGFCGYSQAKSPLRSTESIKFTLLEAERKPVWNTATQAFDAQDMLPVSLSADHRIFDGNIPVPKLLQQNFQLAYEKMEVDLQQPMDKVGPRYKSQFIKNFDRLMERNIEAAYKALNVLQTYWIDYLQIENILSKELTDEIINYYQIHLEDN